MTINSYIEKKEMGEQLSRITLPRSLASAFGFPDAVAVQLQLSGIIAELVSYLIFVILYTPVKNMPKNFVNSLQNKRNGRATY